MLNAPPTPSSKTPSTVSEVRLAANRSNALRSTGPRTEEGKTASSRNAITHGLLTRMPLLPDEDRSELEDLATMTVGRIAPKGPLEEVLANEIVDVLWRLRRAGRIEASLLRGGLDAPLLSALRETKDADAAIGIAFSSHAGSLSVLSRYETALVHRLRRSILDLERMQAARTSVTPVLVAAGRSR